VPPTPVRNEEMVIASILYLNVLTPSASAAASSSRIAER
jgi:hypothetical protein